MIWRIAAAMALLAGLVLGYGAWAKRIGDIRETAVVARYTEAALIADRAARAKEQAMQAATTKAVNESKIRQTKLAADAAAAHSVVDSLRDDLRTASSRLSTASRDAAAEYATTLGIVFADCSREYGRMAKKAGGHANDVRMMLDAQPVN